MSNDRIKYPRTTNSVRRDGEPGRVLPQPRLESQVFHSPLMPAPSSRAAKSPYRAAVAIIGVAVLASAGLISAAWYSRTSMTSITPDGDGAPRVSLVPIAPAAPRAARAAAVPQPPRAASALPLTAAAAAVPSLVSKPPTQVAPAAPKAKPERAARISRRSRRQAREAKAAAALPETPSRADVIKAMTRVSPAVYRCFGEAHGVAKVTLFVRGSTGRVTTARVKGQPGKTGSCIARAVRSAKFPKFAKSRLEISYPFQR